MKNTARAAQSVDRQFYGPAWRWRLAQCIADETLPQSVSRGDRLVREAAEYLTLRRGSDGQEFLALRRYPRIHAAVTAWQDPLLQPRIKVLIVGDTPRSELAARLGTDEETVQAIESLFFDLRDQLQASVWMVCRVILPEEEAGHTDLGTHLRAALFGGPLVAQAILNASERLPLVEADRLYDESILLHRKLKQALALPFQCEADRLRFMEMFYSYKIKTDELALAREKLRHRCEQ